LSEKTWVVVESCAHDRIHAQNPVERVVKGVPSMVVLVWQQVGFSQSML
jgi:hypothetical protein